MAAAAVLISILTLALVVTRPRGLDEGVAALLGASLVLLFGLVTLNRAVRVEADTWNIFLFFLVMMATAALADQSGVFDLIAFRAARLARGRVAALYVVLFLAGGGVSLFFANDSAALVLTPVVYALVLRLRLDPLPFVFATTFVADTASLGLPVSNPLNVLVADRFGLNLAPYIGRLRLPALLALTVNLAVFCLLFRRSLRGRFADPPEPEALPGRGRCLALLAVLAAAYLAASGIAFPLGIVACAGAALLAASLWWTGGLDVPRLAGDTSWSILAFIAGMVILVQGLQETGVTSSLSQLVVRATAGSSLQASPPWRPVRPSDQTRSAIFPWPSS